MAILFKRSPHRAPDFDSFRQQESILIVSSLAVVAVLLLVHVSYEPVLGVPNRPLLLILSSFFLVLVLELVWLRATRATPPPTAVRAYSVASVWVAFVFVGAATFLGEVQDRHYAVLLVLPVISSAFRFSLASTLGVAGLAGLLNLLQVRYFFLIHPPEQLGEYFEAFSVSLLLFLVGAVVWFLATGMEREHTRLQRSLDELQRARDKLVAEEKLAAVGRLASSIAHEIRNPVAMIGSSLAAATGGRLAPDGREEMFRIAAAEARRLETLTDDFLSYARGRKPDRKRTPVAATLGYVAGLVRAKAEEKGVLVDVAGSASLEASLDPYQVQQALLNLALNAIDATREGGRVRLGAVPLEDGGCEVYVENEGDAIPQDVASRIFEPFFSTKPRGTGLGLAIARNIARAHGGDAALERNEPGRVRFALRSARASVSPPEGA